MHASQPVPFRAKPNPAEGEWVELSFPITWTFLSDTPAPTTDPAPVTIEPPPMAVALPQTVEQKPEPPRSVPVGNSADVWEMVVPKMARPTPRGGSAIKPESKPVEIPNPQIAREPEPEVTFPSFMEDIAPPSRRLSIPVLAAIGAVVLGVLVVLIGGKASVGSAPPVKAEKVVQAGPLLPIGQGGWIVASEFPRHISLLRGSAELTDFRMEFEGSIENKSLGWIFRSLDPKNFYAMKLELVTPGRNPVVVLTRYSVVNGLEREVTQVPLPATARLDTLYKVRMDVIGNQFTTWVQDNKVDHWIDPTFNKGSLGLLSERGERGTLKGNVRVFELTRQ